MHKAVGKQCSEQKRSPKLPATHLLFIVRPPIVTIHESTIIQADESLDKCTGGDNDYKIHKGENPAEYYTDQGIKVQCTGPEGSIQSCKMEG